MLAPSLLKSYRQFVLTTEAQRALRCKFFSLPGDDGKLKASMLSIKKFLVLIGSDAIAEGTGFFAHRHLPMGEKNPPQADCVLRDSVVKKYFRYMSS